MLHSDLLLHRNGSVGISSYLIVLKIDLVSNLLNSFVPRYQCLPSNSKSLRASDVGCERKQTETLHPIF